MRKSRKERQASILKATEDEKPEKTHQSDPMSFDVMNDPDYPVEAVNSNVIVEEIEMNGRRQRVLKKTYYMIDGTTRNVTRTEQI